MKQRDHSIRKIAGRLLAATGLKPRRPEFPADFNEDDKALWRRVAPYTMTSKERILASATAVEYAIHKGIPGDIVECGAWRGGSSMAMALRMLAIGATTRRLVIFDTFEGMPPPGDKDRTRDGMAAASTFQQHRKAGIGSSWCYASKDDVWANLKETGYPEGLIELVQGKVEDTIPGSAPDMIAVLRLDTDWYESTKHEMVHLFPRLQPLAPLIIDDYGHWSGAKQAVDEYFREKNIVPLLHRTDDTGRSMIKTA